MKHSCSMLLIRHGETAANQEKRYLGRTDANLSEKGRQQLILHKNRYPKADKVYSSPMKRCLQTGHILYPEQNIHVIEEWKEIDFGEFEGKNYRELQGDARYQAWIDSNGMLAFPQGESREAFIRRCQSGFEKFLGQIKKEKGMSGVTCIVHGGTIMALLSSCYGGEYYDYRCKNGEGYLCEMEEPGVIRTIRPFVPD